VAQFNIGPTYCETLSALNAGSVAFPIEPANTVSNGVIVLFGLASMYMVAKRTPRAYDLYIVSALLVACGIGSGIWHGLRDGTALFWEVRAGLFFLLGLAICWSWRLWSPVGAVAFVVAFAVSFELSRDYFGITNQRWVAAAPAVILFGSILAAQTVIRSKKAALLGLAAMGLSLTALAFRTYDSAVCDSFPMGTHWLWHMFNSAGGFTAMLAIITLQTQGAPKRRTDAIGEAAE
jgi:ceramidase